MKLTFVSSLLVALLATCIHDTQGPAVSLEKAEEKSKKIQGTKLKISALKQALALDEHQHLAPLMVDIQYMLEAQRLEESGQRQAASSVWLKAMKKAEKPFARFAFEAWFLNYFSLISSPKDINLLTMLVLKETNHGKLSAYMKKNQLGNKKRLQEELRTLLASKNQAIPQSQGSRADENSEIYPPQSKGIPKNDPQLKDTASKFCVAGSPKSYQWDAWLRTLSLPARNYWNALVLQCSDRELKAIKYLKNAANVAISSQEHQDHPIAIAAYEDLVRILRFNSARDEAADYYLDLIKAWNLPGLTPQYMGKSAYKISLNHIDNALWAARYRALIGDHQNAKIFVSDAMSLLSVAHNQAPVLDSKASAELAEFKAEGYHILAFRIAGERGEYSKAASLSTVALEIPHLSTEWTERFYWYLGLYEFLDGRMTQAKGAWGKLLQTTKDRDINAKVVFWLAYLYEKDGDSVAAQKMLDRLSQDHPLNFYNVVAPEFSGMSHPSKWENRFLAPQELERKLKKMEDYEISPLRSDPKLAKILAKTELLLFAGLNEYAKIPSDYLYSRARKVVEMNHAPESFIYLSRLLYAVGNYKKAISLSYDLAIRSKNFWQDWPEQIFIYYPRAYLSAYLHNGREQAVDPATLLGISRQESLFDPDAKSPANAIGLMQLIKPTAQRMTSLLGQDWDNLKQSLHEPGINIMLGSVYTKTLRFRYKDQSPAVFAAYNAGEYAVDAWLKRRGHPSLLLWVELIPFGETREYVKKVWRNQVVYQHLGLGTEKVTLRPGRMRLKHASKRFKPKSKL